MKLSVLASVFTLILLTIFSMLSIFMMRTTDRLNVEVKNLDQGARSISVAQSIESRILNHNRNEFRGAVNKDTRRLNAVEANRSEIEKLIETSNQLVAEDKVRLALEEVKARLLIISDKEIFSKALAILPLDNTSLPLITLSKAVVNYEIGNSKTRAPIKGVREIQYVSKSFNSRSDRLDEKRRDQLQFVAAIAHDLRNPLSSMAMASELLISERDAKNRNLTEIILRQVKHSDRLVGDLLDTTRIEAGQLKIQTSEHNLSRIIKDAIELHSSGSNLQANAAVPISRLEN